MSDKIELTIPKLFDNRGNEIQQPQEFQVGDMFFITPMELVADGEWVSNPWKFGPQWLSIPGLSPADSVLIRVVDVTEHGYALTRIEISFDDLDGFIAALSDGSDLTGFSSIGSPDQYSWRLSPFDENDIRGSLNELLQGPQ